MTLFLILEKLGVCISTMELNLRSVHFMNNRLQFTATCSLLGINVLPDFKADINAAVQQLMLSV